MFFGLDFIMEGPFAELHQTYAHLDCTERPRIQALGRKIMQATRQHLEREGGALAAEIASLVGPIIHFTKDPYEDFSHPTGVANVAARGKFATLYDIHGKDFGIERIAKGDALARAREGEYGQLQCESLKTPVYYITNEGLRAFIYRHTFVERVLRWR